MIKTLKLNAFDTEDLDVFSALLQDALFYPSDSRFQVLESRFTLQLDRLKREEKRSLLARLSGRPGKRCRSLLSFRTVSAVQSKGLDQTQTITAGTGASVDTVPLSLLAIHHRLASAGSADPDHIELIFAGGATIRLTVETIDALLTDTDIEWSALKAPHHPA